MRLQFNLKKTCFYVIASLICFAITLQGKSHGDSFRDIYSTLTGNSDNPQHTFLPLQLHQTSDTIPGKKTNVDTVKQKVSTQPVAVQPSARDTIPVDSVAPIVDTFSIVFSKDTLDAPVHYEAEDSAVLLVKDQKFYLYGKTTTTYKDIVLNAPSVRLDQQTNILTAFGEWDGRGNIVTRARFEQGKQNFQSDSIQFNFKTQKGLTANTFTQEGELFIKASTAKKVNANTVFIKEGYYTTCNLDDPHFAFKSNKLKIINDKVAVSGPTHPEFEGVPIPIYLPFGIYPLFQGRHSGFLPPQFTANEQFGLGLEGLGYYHVLNDYYDVTIRGNLYSYGGWTANITPTYRKRYKYSGSFNIGLQHTKIAFKGDPDYSLNKTFNIAWNHSVDAHARPGTTFTANVNAGSTKYNQFIPNNPQRNIQNMLTSSIAYGKQWRGRREGAPSYSLQLSANHNQNNNSGLIYVTLPDAGFSISTVYPFQRKEMIGAPKWYEKIGVGYSGTARNQIAFYDSAVSFKNLLDTLTWGARHSFPISLQLPPLGDNIFVSPSISYEETWLTHRYGRRWNSNRKKVDTIVDKKGLFIDRQMSFGLSLNTNIFGLFDFKNSAIRHVIRPTVGISYRPNLSKRFYDVIQVDTFGHMQALPQFEGNLFSGYGYGRFGGMTFGIDNNLEMKKKNRKDSTSQDKKIRLIDGFSINSAYNFLKDSQKLEPFNISLRSTLFEKISLTASALLDPYDVGPTGLSVDRFVWQGNKFRLGTIRYGSVAMSTNFQSKPRDATKGSTTPQQRTITDPALLADQLRLAEYMKQNPAEFVDFNIPWTLNLSYSLSFSRRLKPDYSGFVTDLFSNFSFSNDFSLTPKWKFGTNGYFDFNTRQLTMFTMNISRDLHCWQMSIGVTPIGNFRYFNVTINPKSSILQDLRINRTRTFSNY